MIAFMFMQPAVCMADWSDYHSDQRVDSLPRFLALRYHNVRVGGLIPELDNFNTVTFIIVARQN